MPSSEWFDCRDKKVKKISLQPEGMECGEFDTNTQSNHRQKQKRVV